MQIYIALLRGINVSGQKKIKMTDLKAMLIKIGFQEVTTYIQSGNVIFKSDENDIKSLEEKIKKGIADTFNFNVPVLVKKRMKLVQILQESPFTKPVNLEAKRIYYALLKNEPEQDDIANLVQKDYPNEQFFITKHCVYLNCLNGAGKAKLTNNVIERKLQVSATTRNHRTMLKLMEMSKEI